MVAYDRYKFDGLVAIKKAELVLGDLAPGGVLQPEQFRSFVRVPREKQVLLPMVRMEEMAGPTKEVDKIRQPGRVLHGATSGQAILQNQRSKIDVLAKVTLTSKLLRGAMPVAEEVFEDNIEKDRLQGTIRDMAGEAVARDLEDLLINGDITISPSTDDLLCVTDGLIKLVSTNVVAAGGVYLGKSTLRDVDLTMPNAFRVPLSQMKYLTSHKASIWYRDSLGSRATVLGDKAVEQGFGGPTGNGTQTGYAQYNGVDVVPIPMFPENLGVGQNETDVIYCDPKVIIFGVQRDVRFKAQEDPASGAMIIHITTRVDIKLEHEPMLVKATGILTS